MADEYALNAVVEHVRPFTHVLSALRLSKKQLVRVGVSDRGVTFVAVDDSKSLQAQANFRAETFAAFSANPAAAFSTHDRSARAAIASSAFFDVSLGALIDVLNVFAPLDGETTVSIRWPDRDGKLVLAAAAAVTARGHRRRVRNITHASISPQDESSAPTHAELVFRGERNAFMVPTTTLKAIVDDLEWPSGGSSNSSASATSIAMANIPKNTLAFTARSPETGSLCVTVDPFDGSNGSDTSSCLSEFLCEEPGTWRYRHRFLRAATAVPAHLLVAPHRGRDGDSTLGDSTLGAPDDDARRHRRGGRLKVVHLVRLARVAPLRSGVRRWRDWRDGGTRGDDARAQRGGGERTPPSPRGVWGGGAR